MAAILFPLLNGVRHSFPSTSVRFGPPINVIIDGAYKTLNYGRKRTREKIRANSPDPVAKTRGDNDYKADIEILFAEYYAIIMSLGNGYGDVPFSLFVTINQADSGFPVITDEIQGCTFDEDDGSWAAGPAPLWIKVADLSPLKILRNGLEDLSIPLIPPPGAL